MNPRRTQRDPDRRRPVRTCAGCRGVESPERMVRFVLAPEGQVLPDLAGGAFGRGAWVHPDPACLGKAAPRGLARSFRAPVTTDAAALQAARGRAALRRVSGLVIAARRAKKLAVGGAAVEQALAAGEAALVVVASDARAAAELPGVSGAIASGRAVAFGSKDFLGELIGRSEVGVVAVLDEGLADEIARMIAMAHLPPSSESVSASTEAR